MKTAVEWLVEELTRQNMFMHLFAKEIDQAKEMEKDNVCDAWDDGYDKGMRDRIEKISNPVGNAEQYYNKTFKSK
jgi:uncharacterized protein YceH (UPF0502 family)